MRRNLWWILGLVLVAGGIVVSMSARTGPDDFGWFAYTPPDGYADWDMSWSDGPGSGSALLVTRRQVAGAAVAVLGLVVVAAGVGFRLGRRRA